MNIKKFLEKFTRKLDNYEKQWKDNQRIFHLMEEVGEFAEIILQFKGHKKTAKKY